MPNWGNGEGLAGGQRPDDLLSPPGQQPLHCPAGDPHLCTGRFLAQFPLVAKNQRFQFIVIQGNDFLVHQGGTRRLVQMLVAFPELAAARSGFLGSW